MAWSLPGGRACAYATAPGRQAGKLVRSHSSNPQAMSFHVPFHAKSCAVPRGRRNASPDACTNDHCVRQALSTLVLDSWAILHEDETQNLDVFPKSLEILFSRFEASCKYISLPLPPPFLPPPFFPVPCTLGIQREGTKKTNKPSTLKTSHHKLKTQQKLAHDGIMAEERAPGKLFFVCFVFFRNLVPRKTC